MNILQRFVQAFRLRRHHTRDVARLDGEVLESERRVVALRTDQLVDGNRLVRLAQRRAELDRRFAEALQDDETAAAVSISTEAAHVVEQLGALREGTEDRSTRLVHALTALQDLKQQRTRATLDRAAANRHLSDVLWGRSDEDPRAIPS